MLADKFAEIRDKLRAMDPAVRPTMPKGIWIGDVAGKALDLSHLTNDRIRDFQDADGATCVLREIVGPIAEKGGSRKVEFNVGVGALIGLGFSSALTAGVRAGARFRVVGEISCGGPGRAIEVTFRLAGGLEAKGGVKAGKDSEFLPGAGAKAEGSVGGEVSHFTTRSYRTLADFLLDANRNKEVESDELVVNAEAVFRRLFDPDVAALGAVPAGGESPKSALQIEAARRFREAPAYRILSRRGPDSATVFEAEAAVAGLSATGEGRSKQAAETAAAAALLAKLA